jgi:hypothetical protein
MPIAPELIFIAHSVDHFNYLEEVVLVGSFA